MNFGSRFPALKRWANNHCAYGAGMKPTAAEIFYQTALCAAS
jgi:hypothetical protein